MEETTKPSITKQIDLPELITCITCIAVWLGLSFISPSPLYIPPSSTDMKFPYVARETIDFIWLICILFPFSWVIFVLLYFLQKLIPSFLQKFHIFPLVWTQITSIACTNIIVTIIQVYIGRATPDFYARCGKDSTPDTCTFLSKSELSIVLQSFPSTHSASSTCCLSFLAMFIQKLFANKTAYISVLSLSFFALGLWIGATRIRDYRAHTSDVVAGYVIGFACAHFIWLNAKTRIFQKKEKADYTAA